MNIGYQDSAGYNMMNSSTSDIKLKDRHNCGCTQSHKHWFLSQTDGPCHKQLSLSPVVWLSQIDIPEVWFSIFPCFNQYISIHIYTISPFIDHCRYFLFDFLISQYVIWSYIEHVLSLVLYFGRQDILQLKLIFKCNQYPVILLWSLALCAVNN